MRDRRETDGDVGIHRENYVCDGEQGEPVLAPVLWDRGGPGGNPGNHQVEGGPALFERVPLVKRARTPSRGPGRPSTGERLGGAGPRTRWFEGFWWDGAVAVRSENRTVLLGHEVCAAKGPGLGVSS